MSIWHHISSFCSSVVQCVGIILEQDQALEGRDGHEQIQPSYTILLATSAVGGLLFLNIKKKKKSEGVILIGLCGLMFLSE